MAFFIRKPMRKRILTGLRQIEEKENIRIIYACESGSRAWGFDSENSDYDVRFFFVRSQKYYNTIFPINYADLTLDIGHSETIKSMVQEDLDYVGHDVRKALYLISKGNPDVISWLYSPVKYLESVHSHKIQAQAEKFFNTQTGIYHYIHMANHNFTQYILNRGSQEVLLKKYLYVIRPIVCCYFIEKFLQAPLATFTKCLESVRQDIVKLGYADAIPEIYNLIKTKKSGTELGYGKSNSILNRFCSNSIEYFLNLRKIIPTDGKWTELDELFNETIITQGGPHGSYLFPC